MTSTHNLIMPPNLTAAEIDDARQVLAQVLDCNQHLPLHLKTEAYTAIVLLNELAPYTQISASPTAS